MGNDDIKFPFFKIKALTLRECLDKGIRRVYDPNWLEKNCYLKLPLKIDNKYSPWVELYSEETQEMIGVQTPQKILFDHLHGGLESICLKYTGKISKYDHKDLSDFWFKKLGKMINDPDYDLNERFAPLLLHCGYIQLEKSFHNTRGFHIDCSYYIVTESGKEAYNQWKKQNE